ncbi:MAG: PIN domain-containing protein [Bacteroidota bacterium]
MRNLLVVTIGYLFKRMKSGFVARVFWIRLKVGESRYKYLSEMIVYAESNFVLELALLQEQYEACNTIVSLAEKNQVKLAIPAYSLVEPYETTTRSFKKRQAISEDVRNELRQLGRSASYGEEATALQELTALFTRSQEEERVRLQGVLNRLLNTSELIPLTSDIIIDSFTHQQNGFSPQDAVVYASVLKHLKGIKNKEKVFLNRNSTDFDDPDVQDALEDLGCKLLFRFDDGVDYIQHRLNS